MGPPRASGRAGSEDPSGLRPRILELWTASPTFRRQCTRLAEAAITVAVGLSPLLRPHLRATSKILTRNQQVFFVSTTLRDDLHVEEDLPHELEHVMEQIEARNLALDAARGRDAWLSGNHTYETGRARHAGIRARNEVKDARLRRSLSSMVAGAVVQRPTY